MNMSENSNTHSTSTRRKTGGSVVTGPAVTGSAVEGVDSAAPSSTVSKVALFGAPTPAPSVSVSSSYSTPPEMQMQ